MQRGNVLLAPVCVSVCLSVRPVCFSVCNASLDLKRSFLAGLCRYVSKSGSYIKITRAKKTVCISCLPIVCLRLKDNLVTVVIDDENGSRIFKEASLHYRLIADF